MSRTLLATLAALALVAACSKQDPFDEAFIAKDLKAHPTQEIYEKADGFQYDPPASARVTPAQMTSFVQVLKLAAKIRSVAEKDFGSDVDRTSGAGDRRARFTESMAALGAARAYATAELRASLNLGFNPREEDWIAKQVRTANASLQQLEKLEGTDAGDKWTEAQDPALLSNIELVRKHREELKEWMP